MKQLLDNIYYVGINDYKKDLFEEMYPLTNGSNYNSYLILDEKTVLIDTCDADYKEEYFNNLTETLNGRSLDYLVVEHLEPDHSSLIGEVVNMFPDVTVVVNKVSEKMLENYFCDTANKKLVVSNGEELNIGSGNLKFVFAPQVHWPEVMMVYFDKAKAFFSADAFGSFGASPIDDEPNDAYIEELIRYYGNIVGKFGKFVNNLLTAVSKLDIETIFPLHGVVVKGENVPKFLGIYQKLATYESLNNDTLIVCASVYGNTLYACEELGRLIPNSKVVNLNRTDASYVIGDMFKYKNIVLASITYNTGIFPKMDALISQMKNTNISNKNIYLIENGSWAKAAAKRMRDALTGTTNTISEVTVSIDAVVKEKDLKQIEVLANEIKNN